MRTLAQNKKRRDAMKKTYFNATIKLVEFTEDVVRMSGIGVFESEQPDFAFSDNPWGVSQ